MQTRLKTRYSAEEFKALKSNSDPLLKQTIVESILAKSALSPSYVAPSTPSQVLQTEAFSTELDIRKACFSPTTKGLKDKWAASSLWEEDCVSAVAAVRESTKAADKKPTAYGLYQRCAEQRKNIAIKNDQYPKKWEIQGILPADGRRQFGDFRCGQHGGFYTLMTPTNAYADQIAPAMQLLRKHHHSVIADYSKYECTFQFIDDVYFQNDQKTYQSTLAKWAETAEKGASIFTYEPQRQEWQFIVKTEDQYKITTITSDSMYFMHLERINNNKRTTGDTLGILEFFLQRNLPADQYLSAKLHGVKLSLTTAYLNTKALSLMNISIGCDGETSCMLVHTAYRNTYSIYENIDPLLAELESEKNQERQYSIIGKIMWYWGQATPLLAGSKATSEIFMYERHDAIGLPFQPFKKGGLTWDIIAMLTPTADEFAKDFINLFHFVDRATLTVSQANSSELHNTSQNAIRSSILTTNLLSPPSPMPMSPASEESSRHEDVAQHKASPSPLFFNGNQLGSHTRASDATAAPSSNNGSSYWDQPD